MADGSTSINELCEACAHGNIETIKRLRSNGVDVNAVGEMMLDDVHLVRERRRNNSVWRDRDLEWRLVEATPLHFAANRGHSSAITILVQAGASVNSVEYRVSEKWLWTTYTTLQRKKWVNYGSTPLHLAIERGHVQCVKELLLAPGIDVNIKNKNGNTAVMLAHGKYEIVKLLRVVCEFPVHTFSKVILCGNSGAGKSTLAQAIHSVFKCNEEVGSLKHRVKNLYKAAEPSKPLTAGIIPYNIQSSLNGNMVLYDLAGQPEYYTSHCACIEAISLSSPATFLSLVDISLGEHEITKQLYYWSTMISNVCSKCPQPSEVIVVATHADMVNNANQQRCCNAIEDLAKELFKSQHFAGCVALDATAQFSDGMKRLIGLLRESNDIVIQRCPVISTDCHILFAFLEQIQLTPSEQVVTISRLLSLLQEDPTNVLPTETSKLVPLLQTLSDKGLILFILNKHNVDESWVVVHKDMLLRKVAGVLFAPDKFDEYRGLASNTGLVPISHLTQNFPDLDAMMLVTFLIELKLCYLVEITHKIINEIPLDLANNTDGYVIYFPSLIKVGRLGDINTKGSFGWLMCTKYPYHFFPNRFLHVMMFTLSNQFCSGSKMLVCNPELIGLNRQCTAIWSTGICFNTAEGVTVLVDIMEQFRTLCVAVSFPGSQYQDFPVLQVIRDILNEYSPSVAVQEFVIDPRHVASLFRKDCVPSSLPHVEISTLKDAVVKKQAGVRDANGMVVVIDEWISTEPRLPKLIGIDFNSCRSIPGVGPQLKILMNDIAAVIPAKWRDVGIQLDLPTGILDSIQSQNSREPNPHLKSFEQVFVEWSKHSSESAYTWTHIIGILRKPAIGENDLADNLTAKYC